MYFLTASSEIEPIVSIMNMVLFSDLRYLKSFFSGYLPHKFPARREASPARREASPKPFLYFFSQHRLPVFSFSHLSFEKERLHTTNLLNYLLDFIVYRKIIHIVIIQQIISRSTQRNFIYCDNLKII